MADKKSKKTDVFDDPKIIKFKPRVSRAQVTDLSGQVNANELTSIKALTSYVARNKSVPESVVAAHVQAEFRVSSMEELRREDFERVIKFLVDLRADLLIH